MEYRFVENSDKTREQTIQDLTSFMLRKHYCENDVESFIEMLDASFSWIGAGEQEFAVGAENAAEIFRGFSDKIPQCAITDEEYRVMEISPDVHVCSGRVWISADPF